jgi:D-alanyl-D-alanine carboxypeptidase
LIQTLSDQNLAMGSLTVSKDGAIVYQRAFGSSFISENHNVPANSLTKYRIGSISKMFTAVLILKLIEEGKLQLTTTLDKFYPGLPNANVITVHDLLYHRSGLHNYTDNTNFESWKDKPKTHEELLQIIINKGVDFKPNEKASYCNSNYLILSYIIEKILEKPYGQIVDEKIISNIGLRNTYYGGAIDIHKNESESYKYVNGKWIREAETDLSIHSGAGSIVSTPADLTAFIVAIFTYKLINKKSVDNMKSLIDDYGMGIFPFKFQNTTGFGHGGRIDGFASSVQYFPEQKIAISYCTNGIVYPKDDLLDGVIRICFNKPYTIPQFNHKILKQEELDRYTGTYSSSTMPIKITCKKDRESLIVETQGQPFTTQWIGEDKFMNIQHGFFFEFRPDELILKEGDNIYHLTKE